MAPEPTDEESAPAAAATVAAALAPSCASIWDCMLVLSVGMCFLLVYCQAIRSGSAVSGPGYGAPHFAKDISRSTCEVKNLSFASASPKNERITSGTRPGAGASSPVSSTRYV